MRLIDQTTGQAQALPHTAVCGSIKGAAGQDDGKEARRRRRRLEPAGVLLLRALI
jgi:hypothetical protein